MRVRWKVAINYNYNLLARTHAHAHAHAPIRCLRETTAFLRVEMYTEYTY